MRTLARALAVGSLACLAVPVVPMTAAMADTTAEAPSTAAYFWSGKLPSTITLAGQTQPNPVNGQDTDLDGVARDDLAVAVQTPGRSDKETFLLWDLLELTEFDTITQFVVTLPLTENGPSNEQPKNTYVFGGTPDLSVCASKGGFGSTDAGAYELKPEIDAANCVVAKHDAAKKAYVADITKLARGWLTGDNNGVAVVPAETSQPFQVVFQPVDKLASSIAFTKGEDPFAAEEEVTDVATDLGGTGTATDPGGFDAGTEVGTGEVPAFDTGSVESPVVDTALPAPAEVAPVGPTVAQPVQVQPVALATVPGGPPLGFWLLALLIGGLLLLVSLTTGAAPAPARRRDGRVLQQIQRAATPTRAVPRLSKGLA